MKYVPPYVIFSIHLKVRLSELQNTLRIVFSHIVPLILVFPSGWRNQLPEARKESVKINQLHGAESFLRK